MNEAGMRSMSAWSMADGRFAHIATRVACGGSWWPAGMAAKSGIATYTTFIHRHLGPSALGPDGRGSERKAYVGPPGRAGGLTAGCCCSTRTRPDHPRG